MTKFQRLVGLLLIGLIHSCCNDNISPCQLIDVLTPVAIDCKLSRDIDTAKMYINGTWTWLQEERRRRGQPIKFLTPQTEGYSRTLVLDNETATFYKCKEVAGEYKFAIIKQKEIISTPGYEFPEDEYPVIVFYNLETNQREWYVPIMICHNILKLQYQYVTSLGGEETWRADQISIK
jgi:hypothetical protein